jgi:hypothetical protein
MNLDSPHLMMGSTGNPEIIKSNYYATVLCYTSEEQKQLFYHGESLKSHKRKI